ncbi:DUF2812 domain-containing protein [Massilia sp. Dwa41.01b]|uniref:DUF2812 domain-containing protein n=1 Tax=unclassified Massilia TaxID=2609279 RepID=UPI001603B8D4|nr:MULTISPECIES: DUF2812 domain-containing protein [unclassified Massilia]QNA90004.1 DUF2812 domain-containing protein [Massilia sp. Dwa41.01b]QNB00890.1 DUF2812 domain-containing protein [Massilia sp. Se16.2.3]
MKDQLVSKFKYFWDDDDYLIERWLEDMARQGLHLQGVDSLRTRFVFQRGEPMEMTYRLDFQMNTVSPDYLQLFADAGWERVDTSFGWQFWRAPAQAGRTREIFTDTESRIAKYQRLLGLFGICYGLYFITMVNKGARAWDTLFEIALNLVMMAVGVYATVRLVVRIRKLRNPES